MPRCNDGSWCIDDYCNHAEPGERWCDGEQRELSPEGGGLHSITRTEEDAQVLGEEPVYRKRTKQ